MTRAAHAGTMGLGLCSAGAHGGAPAQGRCATTNATTPTLTLEQAAAYAEHVLPLTSGFLPPFFKLASVQPGERVLDIGCGPGETTLLAAERAGDTGEVLGIDLAPAFIELARQRANEAGSRARFTVMDAGSLDSPSSYWDLVICHLSITEFADPAAALHEIARVLRPVGRVAVSTWGEHERSPWLALPLDGAHAVEPLRPNAAASRAFRYGAPGVLSNLLADNGYADVTPDRVSWSVQYPDTDSYWGAVERGLAGGLDPFAGLTAAQRDAARGAVAPALRKWGFPRSTALHPPAQAFLAVAVKE